MINIDQDILCDYCKKFHDSSMEMCEGSQCERMQEMYLDEMGLSEDNPEEKTFRKLKIRDKIYRLNASLIIPLIRMVKVNSLSMINNPPLRVHYDSDAFNVTKEALDENNYMGNFLNKTDAKNALEELCTKRIVELAKVIGQQD